ncbi:Bax inhibitor 1 [Branchiostoma belcheri]|nr:Bax inhibitor 1 [Branchiostoma belcheri]
MRSPLIMDDILRAHRVARDIWGFPGLKDEPSEPSWRGKIASSGSRQNTENPFATKYSAIDCLRAHNRHCNLATKFMHLLQIRWQDTMGRKVRHVLIFILIMLKEPSMPEAGCDCKPSSHCGKGITSIPQNLPTSISELDLGSNQINTLQLLWLRYNQITTIPSGTFANLRKLQELHLGNNQITTIPSGVIANLPNLQTLYLFCNQITTIHSGAFENLPDLDRLKLRSNKMTAIPLSVFCLSLSTVKIEIDIYSNPWQCDCRMAPVKLIHAFKNQIICAKPAKLKRRKLESVDPKEFICKDPTISPLSVGSCSAAVSTPSVSNTESNTSPSVFKTTAGSTTNPAENTSRKISLNSHFKFNAALKPYPDSTLSPAGTTRVTLTSPLAITSEKPESAPSSPQLTTSTRLPDIQLISHNSQYHWYSKFNAAPMSEHASKTRATLASPLAITSNIPKSAPSFPIPVLIGSVGGSVAAGIVMIGAITFIVWCKIKSRRPPLGLNPNVVGGNTNTAVTVLASDDDHEDTDNLRVQNGQGQANMQSLNVGNLSHNQVLAALAPNHMYAGNTSVSEMASGDDHQYEDIDKPSAKTGQGQSQAITASTTNTTATVMASGDDQTGQGQSQANIQSLKVGNLSHSEVLAALQPNPMYVDVTKTPKDEATTEIANSHDNTGQGQSQVVTESLDVRNLSYGTGQTVSQQNTLYKSVTQSQTITNTAVVMTSGNVQTGQGRYQAITESLDARNLSYGTRPTASQLNTLYKTATVMTGGQDQTEHGQSQAITESNTSTTGSIMTIDHYYQYDNFENNYFETEQSGSQNITESNTSTTATVMTSDHYYRYDDFENDYFETEQGKSNTNTTAIVMTSGYRTDNIGQANVQSQYPTVANLSRNELLAALQSNPMYVDVKHHLPTSTEMASGHDQTGQDQSQANIQSLKVGDLSYNEVLAALQPNAMYEDVKTPQKDPTSTETASGHNQTGHDQSQANIESVKLVPIETPGYFLFMDAFPMTSTQRKVGGIII